MADPSSWVCHQVAKTKQRIEEEKMQIQVVERTQQITLQEQEIIRKEKELEARVKKPAEAEKYRLERLAEAERWVRQLTLDYLTTSLEKFQLFKSWGFCLFSCSLQLIMEAEAEAESIRVGFDPRFGYFNMPLDSHFCLPLPTALYLTATFPVGHAVAFPVGL